MSEIIQAKHPSQPLVLSKGCRHCHYHHYCHYRSCCPPCCSPQPWLPDEGKDRGQETPKGRRDVQALGREGEWAVGAAGKGRLGEDVGSVRMSTWHVVAFILVLCLFHHFYGLVRRHLLKGLFHLDLIEVMQPSPSLNIFFLSQELHKRSICDVIVLFQIFFPKRKTGVIQNIRDNGLTVRLCMTHTLSPMVYVSFSYLVVMFQLWVEAPEIRAALRREWKGEKNYLCWRFPTF